MSFERVQDPDNIIPGFAVGLPPPVDPVELLPASRRSLLTQLRQQREDARNLRQPVLEQMQELRIDRQRHVERERRLTTERGRGGQVQGDDDIPVIDVRKKIAAIDAELKRLGELAEIRGAQSQRIAAQVENCEGWLRGGRPSGTMIIEAPEIKVASVLRKGETATSALDRLRHRLRELGADEHRIQSSPLPSSYAKSLMRAEIDRLAQHGAPDVSALVEAGHGIGWPMTMQRLGLAGVVGKTGDQLVGSAMGEILDTALFIWLCRDVLVQKLEAEIDAISDDTSALSPDDRSVALAALAADRLVIERQEAALVRALQREGQAIEHRADADPRAVLGIALQVVTAEPAGKPWGQAAAAGRIEGDT